MKTENNVQTYTFETGDSSYSIRVVMRDGELRFVARDLLNVLDLDRTSLERLDDDEKGVDSIHTLGGQQEVTVLSQSGLYTLIIGSRKPEAKPFKRWITHEVLPAIALTGVYVDASNRMGETLGAATDEAISVETKNTAALAGGFVAALIDALGALNERLDRSDEADAARIKAFERMQQESTHQLRAMRQELSRSVGKAVRIAKAQRASNKNLDPNRPLSEDDVERFKYLLGTGATAKQIARSLNRTYEVIRRFMDTNQDLVIRTLQHSLL